MAVEVITAYTFDARNGKLTLTGLSSIDPAQIVSIKNVTRNRFLVSQRLAAGAINGNVITLPTGSVYLGDQDTDTISIRYGTVPPQPGDKLDKITADLTYASVWLVNGLEQGQAAAAANASRMLNKLNRANDPVNVLYVGDSTGNEPTEHIYLEAAALAAQFPKYTVVYRLWNDTTRTYDPAVTIQTGMGATPPVLTYWNCSVPGFATFHFIGERFSQAYESLVDAPDVIFISHSHNMLDVTTPNLRASFRPNVLILTEELSQIFPDAGMILMSQNPTYVAGRETWQSIKATELQNLAARHGYGFIDVHQAFMDTGHPQDFVKSDNIHPTTSADAPAPNGSKLWADTVMNALQYNGAVPSPSQRPSYFTEDSRSLIPNTEFATWTDPNFPDGWTLTNVTAAKDTTNFETGTSAMKLTATATGTCFAQYSATPASLGIKGLVTGKMITVGIRVFVPATNTIAGVGLLVKDQAGSATQRRVDISAATRNRFHWIYLTKKIDSPGTLLTIQISPQWSGANAATNVMTVDRLRVVEGDTPKFA